MKAAGALVLILALAGCQSTGDARQETVRWTLQYDVPFDTMVTCLSTNAAQPATAAPQISRQGGVARIGLAEAGASNTGAGEYTVRQLSDRKSQVDWQRSQPAGTGNYFENWSRNVAEHCAQVYAEFGSGAHGVRH